MTNTLKERYEERQQILAEGFMDYFKTGSANIKKFNTTLEALKKLASTYKLQTLQAALQKAESDFQNIVMAQSGGQKPNQNKATALSQAVTFVSIMTSFMNTLKNITTQLPSIQNALKDKQNAQQPLSQILGADAAKFGQLIANQFNKSGGGILAKIGRFFKGGGGQNAQVVLKNYGIDGNTMANDILKLTPAELQKFSQESATTPVFELQATPQNPQNQTTTPAATSAPPTAAAQTKTSAPSQQTSPSTQSQQTPGAPTTPPTAEEAQKRAQILQNGTIKNINAFNPQVLSTLDNNTIAANLHAIAKALGIKL